MQDIARVARVLSEPTRLKILTVLMEGDASPAELGRRLGLTPDRTARHLAALRAAGMVAVADVDPSSGARTYAADAERVGPALEALRRLSGPGYREDAPSVQAVREVRRNSPLRQARTCYDHLGGVAGVALLEAMIARGWLTPDGPRPVYLLTLEGGQALAERGVELERKSGSRRTFAFGCMDWTERRPHLGGALGAAIRRALEEAGYLRRVPGTRVLENAMPLEDWLEGTANSLGE